MGELGCAAPGVAANASPLPLLPPLPPLPPTLPLTTPRGYYKYGTEMSANVAVQVDHANSTNSLSSTQKELKIHGQKGYFWRSRAVEKKITFRLSALPHTFTKVQPHYKATFVKV